MNKKEFVKKVANNVGGSNVDAKKYVDAVIEELSKGLEEEKEISFIGFGKFYTKIRKGRKGRNPQTGEELQIPAKKVPKFKFGATIKRKIEKLEI